MSSAEGWAAQRFGLPAAWYADVAECSGIGFPVSGDATAKIDYFVLTHQKEKRCSPSYGSPSKSAAPPAKKTAE